MFSSAIRLAAAIVAAALCTVAHGAKVSVVSGNPYLAGRKIDRSKSIVLSAGDTASTPSGIAHWSIAEGEVELVVTWDAGPMGIAYIGKRDEPGAHSFPNGY